MFLNGLITKKTYFLSFHRVFKTHIYFFISNSYFNYFHDNIPLSGGGEVSVLIDIAKDIAF